ncbi:unnamed protein product [Caenorhabditis auriculariae]|uniref:RNA cytidine acetyltransferase n=1 Tax=Caenorhabditis auriculariae TaxID=2777116 RepID=A0A8S1GS85_9PELO|nr:unnamed protein product [Caenorhabditis auriculariae]
MRTKLDNRIRALIENGVASGHRTLFAIVGDKGRDQVPILHHIVSKSSVAARPSVLWCYKKELGFSSHRKKRMREFKRKSAVSNSMNDADPFEVFVSTTRIRYCYYNETHTILGNTFGMLVLQDFEALTPNLLARTIETVEGGGIVVLLLQSVNSLRQLFTMTMDVHSRYRTEARQDVAARFNERFILSLASSPAIAVLDDQLRVLPISSNISRVQPIASNLKNKVTASESELLGLKEAMKDTKPIGQLLNKCRTACQAKALLRYMDAITEKNNNVTCSLTAARGRGKSASLGLALAGAIAFGYTNIFVTSPTPENLRTLFEFVVKGLEALDYQEHTDYDLVQSLNPDFRKALVRVNVFREHRQCIQYIQPHDSARLSQAELVVVDEAAAIPLPLVKDLISGPYLVFLASTINGYEGTGRSLSLKLLSQLRQQSIGSKKGEKSAASKGRVLHEITMEESIRYKPEDEVEKWLNRVLCLDATGTSLKLTCGAPPPNDCELYFVNRDTLFSFHTASENFLQQLMAIYVSAHYKNSPNDLQMLSDAPSHNLFVLMAPVDKKVSSIPEVLAIVQVCIEGELSSETVSDGLAKGKRAAGDLLPWTISQQFLDSDFSTMCGGRIVRIAVHPDYQNMGYGSKALELLEMYYLGRVRSLDEDDPTTTKTAARRETAESIKDGQTVELLEERIEPRSGLPPLLLRLQERCPEKLDYLGVSFGLTLPLLKFWKRAEFVPVYLRQNPNELTGEYTCIMLKGVDQGEESPEVATWLGSYWSEFRRRLVQLLSFEFRSFSAQLALSLLQLKSKRVSGSSLPNEVSREELSLWLSNTDLRRLAMFGRNMLDVQITMDLLPRVASLYFEQRLPATQKLAVAQSAILLAVGLQKKSFESVASELDIPLNQIFALHTKAIRKLADTFDEICQVSIRKDLEEKEAAIAATKAENGGSDLKPLSVSLEDELESAATEIRKRQERDRKTLLAELGRDLKKYEISAEQKDLEEAFDNGGMKFAGTIAVKNKRPHNQVEIPDEKSGEKKKKKKLKR